MNIYNFLYEKFEQNTYKWTKNMKKSSSYFKKIFKQKFFSILFINEKQKITLKKWFKKRLKNN